MSARGLGFFEKIAVNLGAIYRYQASQFPRRSALLRGVWEKELKPPTAADLPAIKAEWARLLASINSGAYRQLSVREGLVYSAVALEVFAWFFVGEMIGRRNAVGYLVPADYVSKDTRKKAKELKQH